MSVQSELQVISGRLERGEIDSAQYLEQMLRYVAAQVGCARAGLRVFVDTAEGRALRCVAMYDAATDHMITAIDIQQAGGAAYHERLQRDGSVIAARNDAISAGPLRDYFDASKVVSLMDIGFSVNGVLFGTFSCEQLGEPGTWTQRQLQSLRRISARASLTLMHVVTASIDTTPGALWETSTPNRLATMPIPLEPEPPDK
ncbi:MAG: hypothetical protein KGL99_13720 [Burkholderiales bacterium]|nr:hypothetical protein [Burkholderiales bacterium]MDE2298348.1 hypothetical protein [Burkholderiales bacterium]MDE2628206.1 hypothetical protein [Burkholderiales bacterium]